MKKHKKPSMPVRKQFNVRMNAEQYEQVTARAREWQGEGLGSRSMNDWCLTMLLEGELNREKGEEHAANGRREGTADRTVG